METHRVQPEKFLEHRREQMLPGMLLHVVEAPRPIDFARHRTLRPQWRRQPVRDAILLVYHFDHRHPGDRPHVERLSARRRIEQRSVQI
jgi:hypothetical protein